MYESLKLLLWEIGGIIYDGEIALEVFEGGVFINYREAFKYYMCIK